VMEGYWNQPDKTAEAIDADGWMHTGDLARMDDDGYVVIEGRIKDMVIRGGENIYPREIEEVLYEHPKIAEAVAIGIPHDYRGETVKIFVVTKPGQKATEQEIIDALEIVRQFFHEGLIQSAFWHLFTATIHSDVGQNPQKYSCTISDRPDGGFAENDLVHDDHSGVAHHDFAQGLNKAVYNFMHGIGTDMAMPDWFDFPVPTCSVKRNYIKQAIKGHPS